MPQAQPTFVAEDLFDDHSCTHCGGDAGDTDNNGHIVHGGYGSCRYDMTQLIWLVRGEDVAKPGMLCDDCIDGFVAEGKLEAFSAQIGALPEGTPSEAAYRELFAYGARRVYAAYWQEMGDRFYARRALDDAGRESIERLRCAQVGSEEVDSTDQLKRAPEAIRAIKVGEAHAMAAIALGYGEEDPGFEDAAAKWATQRRSAVDAFREIWDIITELDAEQNPHPQPDAASEQSSEDAGEAE